MSKQKLKIISEEGVMSKLINNSSDFDPIASTKSKASYNPTKDAMDMAGDEWYDMSWEEKEMFLADLERGHDESFNESTVKITKATLGKLIKEGVEKLHKKTLIENRINVINNQLNNLKNSKNNSSNKTEDSLFEALQRKLRKK